MDTYLGVTARDVMGWSTEASYVATFPDDDGVGACDVRVQVGEAGGVWWLSTTDGVEREYCDEWYASEIEAREAARSMAAERHEALAGEDADDYLTRQLAERAGEPSPDGDWAVYWETAGDDKHVVSRYQTREQAEAACELAQQELHARHPGGHLLCGYGVRVLADGQWVDADGEED